jgi:uncharacterized protein YkwD
MISVNLVIVALVIYGAYSGSKRGLLLMGLELASFIIATAVALLTYQPAGGLVKNLANVASSLADVAAFAVIWMITEVLCALLVRYQILPKLAGHLKLSSLTRVGGFLLGGLKYLVIVALALIMYAGLPLSSGTKTAVTTAAIPEVILQSSGQLQTWLAAGLGHDLDDSLNFFTITAEPESEETIELGFKTTGTADPTDEAAMVVWLNHERTSRGLKPLSLNTKARAVAEAHSQDMFAKGYFSHITPTGKNPFDRMSAAGIRFGAAGENLALAPTLVLAENGLMNSPPHRANILDPDYRTVGIGIMDGGPYGLMVTQDFTD